MILFTRCSKREHIEIRCHLEDCDTPEFKKELKNAMDSGVDKIVIEITKENPGG